MHPAFRQGARESLGAHTLAMAATFIAFGAAVHAAGFGLGWGLASSAGVYGMAGQMVLLGTSGAQPGAATAAVAGAVMANARFLPMAAALAPLVRGPLAPLCVPFVAITPWAAAMRRLPATPAPDRAPWFLGFALSAWTTGLLTTALGYALAGHLSPAVLRLLLMVNVLYFGLMIAAGMSRGGPWRASLGGALAAPLAFLLPAGVPPAWGILGAALIGGTAAFLLRHR
ncbi:Predicted branched-chain amino acid permease (azaleucine resistance) [Roseomonas rosea]|uniref:Predicted branched-chain amino acid permease (Azaleucine resistance) n=1 Tax=Muricoccus roseus TaxID=198092 RepID=A0A1M6MVU2_9PROT|nr:AzlC family ABC transporter permease [Roseomonas rosea]SHJ87552.1 Predicted branched-chain amino acid permease (azaleucine resistance) [Roseomonas rosea]